ncbi:MAG: hypothetical protein CNLJKLNK_00513 [Holosporales bacterium]
MKKIFFSFLMLIRFSFAEDIKTVIKPLKSGQILKVHFEQKKFIKEIPKPLISCGIVIIDFDKGLLWQTEKPFKQGTLLSQKGIFMIQDRQKIPVVKSNESQSKKISEILSKILSADFDALDFFDIETLESTPKYWKKRLIPKVEGIKNFLKAIDVIGDRHIHEVHLHRTNNDTETIVFKKHKIFKKEDALKNMNQEERDIFE